MSDASLTPELLERLVKAAQEAGIPRLAAVDVTHPAFDRAADALDRYLDEGFAGEMAFMERTREVRKRPDRLLAGARTVLVGLVPYRGEAGPVARYAQWADYHTQLHRRLEAVAQALSSSCAGASTLICVDSKPLSERTAAMAAGLGFLGKHGCLIAPGLGSYVLLGAVLTDVPLANPSKPETRPEPTVRSELGPSSTANRSAPWDACGSCTKCLDACPTSAFVAPGRLDPRRCIAYLTIEHRGDTEPGLAAQIGERVAGCDVCQEVCPYNASPSVHTRVDEHVWLPSPPGRERDPDPVRLANIGNNQHKGLVRHTPLNRIPRANLRKNALIALGNRSTPLAADEREALERALRDPDPTLQRWAAWALSQRTRGPSDDGHGSPSR